MLYYIAVILIFVAGSKVVLIFLSFSIACRDKDRPIGPLFLVISKLLNYIITIIPIYGHGTYTAVHDFFIVIYLHQSIGSD